MRESLGPTSSGNRGQGVLLHTTMGVDVSGGIDASPFVLGLGHQQVWVRPHAKKDKPPRPESCKGSDGIEAIGAPPAQVNWVHVGDRESDCFEAMDACRQQSSGFAFRACQDRRVIAGHTTEDQPAAKPTLLTAKPALLFELLKKQPMLGGKQLWVRGRGDREPRWAKLAVSAMPVTLLAPKNWPDKAHRKDQPRPAAIACWAVRVWEVDPPADGEEPIEWIILTNEPAVDLESALWVVFWYSCRWLIEEYHKCLKTGCRIEQRQLQEGHRLMALLGIVSIRLLQLKHQAKVNPDTLAQRIVPKRYVKTLAAPLKLQAEKITARQFWRETARLGGFLCRKGDGDPGWITLWRGWQHLETLTAGMELAKREKKCG
ncbi:MAG: IS4 family transposase [Tepidisphaeraceae bacterium]